MPQIDLTDQIYRQAQRRASEAGFTNVEEYIADIVSQDSADDADNFDHLFTPEVVRDLERISAAAKAGGRTYTSEEVREHLQRKSEQWRGPSSPNDS